MVFSDKVPWSQDVYGISNKPSYNVGSFSKKGVVGNVYGNVVKVLSPQVRGRFVVTKCTPSR